MKSSATLCIPTSKAVLVDELRVFCSFVLGKTDGNTDAIVQEGGILTDVGGESSPAGYSIAVLPTNDQGAPWKIYDVEMSAPTRDSARRGPECLLRG